MRKKTLFLAGLTAAFLLGWAGYLPSGAWGQTDSAEQGDEEGQATGGSKGNLAQQQENNGRGENGEQGNGGEQGEEGGETGDGGDRGENGGAGSGGDHGNGRGENRPAAKRVSYKDSAARAAKYTARKQYAGATREYNKALTALAEDDNRKVYVYERQGWLALMQNDVPSAEGFYLAAIYQAEKIETFDKNAVNAYRGAAYCYEKEGDISSAVENYQLALKHAADKVTKADIRKKLQRLQSLKKKKAR
jgi:tetratricopeptide (TPR) repeat protein